MIPRQTLLPFGIAAIAVLLNACATLQSSPGAAAALMTELYDLKTELNSQIQEARRGISTLHAIGEKSDLLEEHPLFYTVRKKVRQLAAQYSSPAILATKMAEVMSEEEGVLLGKMLELDKQVYMLLDQMEELNNRHEQSDERFSTLLSRALALTRDGHEDIVHVAAVVQEVSQTMNRLHMLSRTWNERMDERIKKRKAS
jgi:hypothetical protein